MAQLTLEKLQKRYGNHAEVIKSLDLQINSGEFVVIVGPSGCGKSTLLRMIAGLEAISGGGMYIDGNYVNDDSPAERGIGMVFQSYALYPHMTVYQNMAFALELAKVGKSEIDRRVRDSARAAAGAVARPQAERPVRRPAPAGGDRPRHRARTQTVSV